MVSDESQVWILIPKETFDEIERRRGKSWDVPDIVILREMGRDGAL